MKICSKNFRNFRISPTMVAHTFFTVQKQLSQGTGKTMECFHLAIVLLSIDASFLCDEEKPSVIFRIARINYSLRCYNTGSSTLTRN